MPNYYIRIISRRCGMLKYVGILGIPGIFLSDKIFDILFLFWLFGLIEILTNFQVHLIQTPKMIWGMIAIPMKYGSRLPSIDNYSGKIAYSLPFHGTWTVVNGGIDKSCSHSWNVPTQRYAYDFVVLGEEGKSFAHDAKKAENYYCYGKEILAPADGVVVEVGIGRPDSYIWGKGRVECSAHDIRGNYILICHEEKEYSMLAHLKPGSTVVTVGDRVKRGQVIALCGNSGNSSEPHLHFQLQDGINFYGSAGLPIKWENIEKRHTLNYEVFDQRPIPELKRVVLGEEYILRGDTVFNR